MNEELDRILLAIGASPDLTNSSYWLSEDYTVKQMVTNLQSLLQQARIDTLEKMKVANYNDFIKGSELNMLLDTRIAQLREGDKTHE